MSIRSYNTPGILCFFPLLVTVSSTRSSVVPVTTPLVKPVPHRCPRLHRPPCAHDVGSSFSVAEPTAAPPSVTRGFPNRHRTPTFPQFPVFHQSPHPPGPPSFPPPRRVSCVPLCPLCCHLVSTESMAQPTSYPLTHRFPSAPPFVVRHPPPTGMTSASQRPRHLLRAASANPQTRHLPCFFPPPPLLPSAVSRRSVVPNLPNLLQPPSPPPVTSALM